MMRNIVSILSYYPGFSLRDVLELTEEQVDYLAAGLVWRGVLSIEEG